MNQAIENLRLLFFANLNQPVMVAELRSVYLNAGGDVAAFAPALAFLRQKELLAQSDPVSCTERGLRKLQSLQNFKERDSARMFLLKERIKRATFK
ncbi:hypothetical protein [Granulicella mallensis]|uniref:hypothetical protein n=1 Tax=Granulicella mallensis TaxID=940614 RepID=UPI0005C5185B|nr:hypothetical protein [Granulicella mallensis]